MKRSREEQGAAGSSGEQQGSGRPGLQPIAVYSPWLAEAARAGARLSQQQRQQQQQHYDRQRFEEQGARLEATLRGQRETAAGDAALGLASAASATPGQIPVGPAGAPPGSTGGVAPPGFQGGMVGTMTRGAARRAAAAVLEERQEAEQE